MREPLIQQRRWLTVCGNVDGGHPMVVVGQPPTSDRGLAWQFVCIDHPPMAERPFVRAPAALAILCRSEVPARRAHARNQRPRCRLDVDSVGYALELIDNLMVLLAETLCVLTYVVVALPKFRRLLFWRKLRVAFDRVLPPRAALRTQRLLIDIVPRPTTFEFGDAVGVHKM